MQKCQEVNSWGAREPKKNQVLFFSSLDGNNINYLRASDLGIVSEFKMIENCCHLNDRINLRGWGGEIEMIFAAKI